MNLLRCRISGFGRLGGLELAFRDGLNLVFAPNEGGKSTLQRFLIGLLYGQLRADLKAQRRLDPWVEEYKPWRGSEYGGILWCALAGGRELEVSRLFGKEEGRVEIRTMTGEDIAGEYEQQRNGEVLFARAHFGLPKPLFESVAVIRENRVAELNSRDTVRDRVANLAQAGDEELSLRLSLDRLEAALESVGSDRAPTRPYKQALDRLQALQKEQDALRARRAEFEGWVADKRRLAEEVQRLDGKLAAAQGAVAAARWREASERVRVLVEIDREIHSLRRKMESSEGRETFPSHNLEELNRLLGAKDSIETRLAEKRGEIQAAMQRLGRAEAERKELAPYEGLVSTGEADKVTEWFVSYLGLSLLKENAQKSLHLFGEETHTLENNLSQLGDALNDPAVDWQRKARESAQEERIGSARSLELLGKISEKRQALIAVQSRMTRWRVGGIAAFAATLLSLGALPLITGSWVVRAAIGVAAACFAITAGFLLRAWAEARRQGRPLGKVLADLEIDYSRQREEVQKYQSDLHQVVAASGFETLEEFLEAARQAEQWRQRMAYLRARIGETEQQRDKLTREAAELYSQLQGVLSKVELKCSPATLKGQVDLLRRNLKRFRDLEEAHRGCLAQLDSLLAQEAELTGEAGQRASRIQAIFEEAGVDSAEAFRDACQKRQLALELAEKEASRVREFRRLCGNETLEEWQEQVRELEQIKAQALPSGESRAAGEYADSQAPYLPYLPSVSETEQEEKRIASLLAAVREEHARVIERVSQAFRNYRAASEIEEDLALGESALKNLACNREALNLASETIRVLSRQQQEVLAPQLNYAVERRFLRLCRGRYQEVKIDPDFQVWVREPAGELRPAERLSRGTQDQLYFALRFGILDLVSDSEEPCPCLLDEPFAAYDRERMREAFRILDEESRRRQLLLFTCREDLRDLARAQDAHVLELPL